jgi:hypothetical protein
MALALDKLVSFVNPGNGFPDRMIVVNFKNK